MSTREGFGMVLSGSPIKKCPEVSAMRSSGSSDSAESGLELRVASICVSSVVNSSKVNGVSPMVRLRLNFTDFTAASHFPPK